MAVAHFVGFGSFNTALLELTLQALCYRLLRRLKSKLLKQALSSARAADGIRSTLLGTLALH
jgi:hypothetical protein